jgi:hypothetical protein
MHRHLAVAILVEGLGSITRAHAQQTWGVVGGAHFYHGGETFSTDSRGVLHQNTRSLGLLSSDMRAGRSHWVGALVWQRRTFSYRGWLSGPHEDHWGELEERVDLLELTFAARIALSSKGNFTFDVEPVIDWRFAEETTGTAYTTHAAINDTIQFDQDRTVDRGFSGARLRIGISGDIPLVDRTWMHVGGRLGWGADEWSVDRLITSWDRVFRVGLHRSFGPRVTITPVWE